MIEGALSDAGSGDDVVDRGGLDALRDEQGGCRRHQVVHPDLGGLSPSPTLRCAAWRRRLPLPDHAVSIHLRLMSDFESHI